MSTVTLNQVRASSSRLNTFRGRLIVSCQAPDGDPFRFPESMARFAKAAVAAGAAGIRANGPEDVRAIRGVVDVPIIALQKRMQADGLLLITPSFGDAAELAAAGADMIAVDCTIRGQKAGALDLLRRIRNELGLPVVADIAIVEEAIGAAAAGADAIASTMRGYTVDTGSVQAFEPAFIEALVQAVDVPIFAEGRIRTPAEAALAITAGAHAVIVGTSITRPEAIAAQFVDAVRIAADAPRSKRPILGVDIGGTNMKCGVVMPDGTLRLETCVATPHADARDALMKRVQDIVADTRREADQSSLKVDGIGIATAGCVDEAAGSVKWATSNPTGWSGAPIAAELRAATGLRVAVENDAVAVAVAERYFGAGRGIENFVCLTLGTGVGGGCYIDGRLLRGAHGLGNALGHICIERGGLQCSCGRKGCLERYANAAALARYAGSASLSADAIIAAAAAGQPNAVEAIHILGSYLARALDCIVHILDPEVVVISGRLAHNNDLLFRVLNRQLATTLMAAEVRRLTVRPSALGYYAGVIGAAQRIRES